MLNARRSLDPRWMYHHRRVAEGFMVARVTITRRSEAPAVWDPATGTSSSVPVVVWEGRARIQPNKDWRVRYVETGLDPQLMQIVRVQIPLRKDSPPPLIKQMDIIKINDLDRDSIWVADTDLGYWQLTVRNMLNSSNPWLRNISAIVDVSDPEED